MARTPVPAERLRLLASQILAVADLFEEPAETTTCADLRIDHVETLAQRVEQVGQDLRAVVRGRG